MVFTLAVVVSAHRHCPRIGTVANKALYPALQDYEKPTSVALDQQTSARCQADPVRKKVVVHMPRENGCIIEKEQDPSRMK